MRTKLSLLCAMAALGAAIVAFVGVSPAEAKSFRIVAVQVEAVLHPDASMTVVEHITYDFDGSFTRGSRPIPRSADYEIVDMAVSDRATGQPLPAEGAPYDLTFLFDAANEERTFDIAYRVVRAAKVGPDVAELYWKFVGTDHPGIGRVRVQLDVPGDGLDVRAWAHGPLQGLVELQGTRVLLSVDGVPGGQFVEARVAVPSAAFSAPPSGEPRLATILAEEQRLADEANAVREREADAARRRAAWADRLGVLAPVLALLGWVAYALLWTRYGREHAVATDVGEYLREPPDDPPAHVILLRNWATVTPQVLSATIVDLAQRGHVTIEELRRDRWLLSDKVDWRFTRCASDDPLRPFERRILDRLFADASTITQSEFEEWCERNRTSADRWWDKVKDEARDEFRARGYIEGGKGPVYAANVLAGALVVTSGALAVSLGALAGLIAVVSGVAQLAATAILRRRTPSGAQRLAEWEAFERFLRDFSQLEDAPVGHLLLWERYLVYAVALGVTAAVARALAAKIPAEVAAQQGFASWYHGSHGGVGALDSIGSLADFTGSFGPTIVAAAQPPSSSSSGSGGGGGFSGGGGGGGGGGGIGAS